MISNPKKNTNLKRVINSFRGDSMIIFNSFLCCILIGLFVFLITDRKDKYHFVSWENTIKQSKPNNCGPTALLMIFTFYGIKSNINDIEKGVNLNKKGTSMYDIKLYAQKKGLFANGIQTNINNLNNYPFPLLAYINNSHFVIVDSLGLDKVYLRDPIQGKIVSSFSYFTKKWDGSILHFSLKNNSII